MKILLTAIGLLMIMEGVPYFLSPDSMKKMASVMQEIHPKALRILGFLAMCGGLLMVWLVNRP